MKKNAYVSTYSILAADPAAGLIGGAVQSHYFNAGTSVLWAEPGVGVAATQALVNIEYGPRSLELLRRGFHPEHVISSLTEADEGSVFRQLAVVNAAGETAVYTGENCIREAGHISGSGFTVQANMMASNRVWSAMAETYLKSDGLPLWDRLYKALAAAETAGGDIRGRQAAGIVVVKTGPEAGRGNGRIMDLQVADHNDPLNELKRLMKIHSAYVHADRGDTAMEEGDTARAIQEYSRAESLCPDNLELQYWHAVALANAGDYIQAEKIFSKIFSAAPGWEKLTRRLAETGLIHFSLADIGR